MRGRAVIGDSPRRAVRRHVAWTWQTWLWLGIALAVTGLHAFQPPDSHMGQWSYLAVGMGASVAAWIGSSRAAPDRVVGRLVALGVTLSASGDLISQLLGWFSSTSADVTAADLPWLGSYVALSAALLRMLRLSRDRRGAFLDGLADVAVIGVLVLLVEWEVSVGALVRDDSLPVFTRLVWTLYPACDALLIALVIRVATTRQRISATSGLFAVGAVCWLASDFTYLLTAESGALTRWMDTGWLVGAMLLASSTWQRSSVAHADARDEGVMGRGSLALGLLPLLAPGAIALVGARNGSDPDPLPLVVATLLLVLLAFVRGLRLLGSEARSRERLRSQERYATAVAANSADAVIVMNRERLITNDAHQFAMLMGSPELATRGASPSQFFSPTHPDLVDAAFARAIAAPGKVFEEEYEGFRTDGGRVWIGTRIVNLLDDPDVAGVVINIHDVTHRKEAEQDLAHQTLHDALTGLPNRALFSDRVDQALRRDRRSGFDPAIIHFGLDAFKAVNDNFGHGAGDHVLCEVTRRLLNAVRAGGAVTRLGADEFAVLIEQTSRPLDEAEEVTRRVLQLLEVPVEVESRLVTVSAGVGIAVADAESTASSLLRDADVAMSRAKALGKGRYVVYEVAMRDAVVERRRLESDLIHALVANQFRLAYQPVVSLATDRVVGFEALLRWHHPDLGVVPPDKFIPIAEESGLIVPIGRWVLDEACRQAAEWQETLPPGAAISMAVNVSASQIGSANLVQHVAQSLAGSGLAPEALVLELTESVLVHDADLAARRLHELQRLGVRLAIDDFGTGYSSLSYLRRFPFDILKVDRSFVATITDADAIPAIVRGLLELGRTLGLETVAEGVEDAVQRDALRALGCDLAQGYLYARPMTPAAARELLGRQLATHASADSPV